jgi:hypothetical protein
LFAEVNFLFPVGYGMYLTLQGRREVGSQAKFLSYRRKFAGDLDSIYTPGIPIRCILFLQDIYNKAPALKIRVEG